MKVFWDERYVAAKYAFDTTRKSQHLAESLVSRPIEGVEIASPTAATPEQLKMVHTSSYVDDMQTGGPGSGGAGFGWDEGLWIATSTSTGGVIDAVKTALKEGVSGSLSSGLHHARADYGSGFCTFNGLALASKIAVQQLGLNSVLIIDTDAHGGGGTYSIIGNNSKIFQLDVAVCSMDGWKPVKPVDTQDVVHDAKEYLPTIRKRLDGLEGKSFDLVIYNAGMDPHQACGCGGLHGISRKMIEDRERMVFEWCRENDFPVAFVLAGGYTGGRLSQEGLTNLHRLTIEAAVDAPRSAPDEDPEEESKSWSWSPTGGSGVSLSGAFETSDEDYQAADEAWWMDLFGDEGEEDSLLEDEESCDFCASYDCDVDSGLACREAILEAIDQTIIEERKRSEDLDTYALKVT